MQILIQTFLFLINLCVTLGKGAYAFCYNYFYLAILYSQLFEFIIYVAYIAC